MDQDPQGLGSRELGLFEDVASRLYETVATGCALPADEAMDERERAARDLLVQLGLLVRTADGWSWPEHQKP